MLFNHDAGHESGLTKCGRAIEQNRREKIWNRRQP